MAVGGAGELARVGDRLHLGGDDERRREGDLEAGLVEAGERPPRGDRLELGERVVHPRLRRLVEALLATAERRVEHHVHARLAGGNGRREREPGDPAVVLLLPRGRDGHPALGRDARGGHVHVLAVEPDRRARTGELDVDVHRAREALLPRIDVELDGPSARGARRQVDGCVGAGSSATGGGATAGGRRRRNAPGGTVGRLCSSAHARTASAMAATAKVPLPFTLRPTVTRLFMTLMTPPLSCPPPRRRAPAAR